MSDKIKYIVKEWVNYASIVNGEFIKAPGQVFLLQAMAQASSTFSALPPSVPFERKSTKMR